KYLTLWNYVADPLIFVVNKQVWESWTEEDRKIVAEAAKGAAEKQIVISRKGVTPEDDSLRKEIEGLGVTVTALTPEQHQAFVDATKDVFEKWKKTIGEDLVNQAQKDIENR